MGESRGDKVRIWTDVPLQYQITTQDNEGEDEVEDKVPELMKVKVIVPLSSKCKG
jgi:hypothetical protein